MNNQGIQTVSQRRADSARCYNTQRPGHRPQARVAKLLVHALAMVQVPPTNGFREVVEKVEEESFILTILTRARQTSHFSTS